MDDWKVSAAEYVRAELFDKKQFVTDEELVMGGSIQKLVCAYINICGGERAIEYSGGEGRKGVSPEHLLQKAASCSKCHEACIQR